MPFWIVEGLAVARSHSRSDMPPACHSLRSHRCATSRRGARAPLYLPRVTVAGLRRGDAKKLPPSRRAGQPFFLIYKIRRAVSIMFLS